MLYLFALFLQLAHPLLGTADDDQEPAGIPCGNFDFSHELLRRLVEQDKNLVVSPVSLQIVLAMVARGAVGPTSKQILDNALSFSSEQCKLGQTDREALRQYLISVMNVSRTESDEYFRLKYINYLAVKGEVVVKERLVQVLRNLFNFRLLKGEGSQLVKHANQLVARDTNQIIQNLLPEDAMDDPASAMVLITAIYLKASWFEKFDELDSNSPYGIFHQNFCGNGNARNVDNMMQKNSSLLHYETNQFKAIKIPFSQPAENQNGYTLNMYIIVPKGCRSPKQILNEVGRKTLLENLLRPGVMTSGYYQFIMPKFNITTTVDEQLTGVLQQMGITYAFEPSNANFSRMFANANEQAYFVSKVAQKCVIKVDEEGVEAAPATSLMMTHGGIGDTSIEHTLFVVNRPFLFFLTAKHPNDGRPAEQIYETVLFAGQYVK